jgi:apolipoprotein D and lipocalin family protein
MRIRLIDSRRLAVGLALSVGLVAGAAQTAAAQSATAAPALDLNRYMGTWYEVARLPDKAERRCVGGAMVLNALADKPHRFQVVDSCRAKDGYTNVRNFNGKEADKSGGGKLKLSSFWPFSTKYWVLALGPTYDWALVGNPNHKSLWVLSRTATLPPEELTKIEALAAAQGFDTSKLAMVKPQ